MIIAIDAGNSRIKWGIHDGSGWGAQGTLPIGDIARLDCIVEQWPDAADVVACCVAGDRVEAAIESAVGASGRRLRWVRSGASSAYGVRNTYEQPGRLGADRWAAMIGARAKTSGACLVVCAGTATTVDWLDVAGNFRAGLILPGLRLMCAALARNTAQLPDAEGEFRDEPRNTMDAIVSGCLHAQAGAIERMFVRASAEGNVLCLMTGGAAHRIAPCLGIPFRMEEMLVLDGLLRHAS
ncbi:MAG: type III pantothenate kinase [Candidatus Accumulibacter sp.]|jgi:type III pantothenate kinase|nr:type III pantothenate kinase [Accumulibacter sp.]